MWINCLLTPTLKSIQIVPTTVAHIHPAISCLSSSAILQGVARTCPRLQELVLYPSNPVGAPAEEAEGTEFLLNLLEPKSVFHYFSLLQYLCTLETGPLVVRLEGLQALSSLPRLKHLTVLFFVNGTLDSEHNTFHDDDQNQLFPALG